jgi:hypothetical protein
MNEHGGEIRFLVPKAHAWRLDELVLLTFLGCIGETLDEFQDVINGVAFEVRSKQGDRIAIWCRTIDEAKVRPVMVRFKALLKLDDVDFKFNSVANLMSKETPIKGPLIVL